MTVLRVIWCVCACVCVWHSLTVVWRRSGRMAQAVVALLGLLVVCGAAKLDQLSEQPPTSRPLAFGDRLRPLRRLRGPLLLPLPPGVRPPVNYTGTFLPFPPGVRPTGNFSLPLLLPLPPALRGAVNASSPLLALPPQPPGVVLPANFSTRVARHQLPLLVR